MQAEQHEIETLLGYRARTDHRISERLLVAPILTYVILAVMPWIVIGAFGQLPVEIIEVILVVLGTVGLFASAFTAYLVYLLVNRRNNHFEREQAMFGNVLEILRAKVPPSDANGQWRLSNNYRCYQWLGESSGERSAILQALLVLTPFLGWVLLKFGPLWVFIPYLGWVLLMFELLLLTDDWKEHEFREDYMIQEVNGTLGMLGLYQLPNRLRPSPIRSRSAAVYLILSIFTLGVAELVWLYLSTSDPYEHFEFHSHFEFPLAGLLGPPKPPAGVVA